MFLTAIFILILNLNQSYKDRYFEQFTYVLTKDGISYYLNTSIYGAHYKVAYEIFKDNQLKAENDFKIYLFEKIGFQPFCANLCVFGFDFDGFWRRPLSLLSTRAAQGLQTFIF